jgi:hypothetical protein
MSESSSASESETSTTSRKSDSSHSKEKEMLTPPPKSKSSFLTFLDDNEVIFCKIVSDSRMAGGIQQFSGTKEEK